MGMAGVAVAELCTGVTDAYKRVKVYVLRIVLLGDANMHPPDRGQDRPRFLPERSLLRLCTSSTSDPNVTRCTPPPCLTPARASWSSEPNVPRCTAPRCLTLSRHGCICSYVCM
jgi:hypothetical protein